MHLKSVEISGFKTFARKTEILLEAGITAVVGPNGSGKSNLVDAIRWVLGERSARELRGTRMEEVVYSGGARRPAAGMAEVRLVLDNSDGRLPLPYTEVEVMRRGYRSGESEYWLNGSRARLRDIEELFASTGVTQQGYSVVAQDDVDHIIQTTAGERRALIEEAAGVRGLQHKRQDALARLRAADVDLLRLRDLARELEPRVVELRSQAEKARRQQELQAELATLRGSLLRGEWLAARQREQRAGQRVETLGKQVAAARVETEQASAEYERRREQVAAAHDARLTRERELGTLRLAATHAEARVALLAERGGAAAEALTAAETRLAEARARSAGMEPDAGGDALATLAVQLDGARRQLAAAAEALAQADAAHRATIAEEESARGAAAAVDAHLERLRERVASLRLVAPGESTPPPGARRLAELVDVAEGLGPAVEAALGRELLDSWVAPDPAAEERLARDLGAAGGAGTALLVHSAAVGGEPGQAPVPGAEPLLLSVRAAAWLRPALAELLHDVWLVEDEAAAVRLVREQRHAVAVTRQGVARTRLRISASPQSRTVDAGARLRQAEADLAEAEAARVAADEGVKLARGALATAAATLEQARAEHGACLAQEAGLAARVDAVRGRAERTAAMLVRAHHEVEEAESRAGELRASLAGLESERAQAEAEAGAARAALAQAPAEPPGEALEGLTEAVLAAEKANLEARVALAHQEDALAAAQAQLEVERAAVAELEAQLPPDARAELEGEVDWMHAQRQIARLERQLAQLGPVNELAIAEFERDSGRLAAIAGQLDDLDRARADLDKLATELGVEIERRFEAVFGAVAVNFQDTFAALFPGGKATLRLDDPALDEPGVEILAQPAGKRMRSIRLLSGGERALTALSFILALERVTPSPFYIFDEVDAPLDDANVKRFNAMLASMAEGNQFILITHNHATMAAARALYGITLEDSGVSRVVSVRLEGKQVVANPEGRAQAG